MKKAIYTILTNLMVAVVLAFQRALPVLPIALAAYAFGWFLGKAQ